MRGENNRFFFSQCGMHIVTMFRNVELTSVLPYCSELAGPLLPPLKCRRHEKKSLPLAAQDMIISILTPFSYLKK